MNVYPIKIILKDGDEVECRQPNNEDLDKIAIFLKKIPKSDLVIVSEGHLKKDIINWFISPIYKKSFQLIVLKNNKIISIGTHHNEGLYWGDSVEFKLLVHPKFRGRGIGKQLFKILLHEAIHKNFRKILVRYLPKDKSFINILQKFNFSPESSITYPINLNEISNTDVVIASYNIDNWDKRFEFYYPTFFKPY